MANRGDASQPLPVQKKANRTGLPDSLKSGIEQLSGYSMDDVKVHYNSGKPAQMQAHAYAQGSDIHLGPGQERHLPHEAWHVVQQAQGRVRPTMQMKRGVLINDDVGLEREADMMGGALQKQVYRNGVGVAEKNGTGSQAQTSLMPMRGGMETSLAQRQVREMAMQKVNSGPGFRSIPIQREVWSPGAQANEQTVANNLNNPLIAGTNNTQIGAVQDPANAAQTTPGERHLDPRLLALLETVLLGLPDSHVKGNASLARVVLRESMGANGAGMASFFDSQTSEINIVVPGDVNSWFYLQVERWPFGDAVTTLLSEVSHLGEQWGHYAGGTISGTDFLKEVIEAPGRFMTHNITTSGKTLDKVSQGLSTESFVQWIIRHETGHSVDDAIGWYANNHYQNVACGGWQVFTAVNEQAIATEVLNSVGINGGILHNLDLAFDPFTHAGYNSMQDAIGSRVKQDLNPANRAVALNIFEGTNPGGTRLVDFAENAIRIGLSRPWESGGAPDVGGRSYHRDTQHDTWVSYIHAKYDVRNSNYQFQNPGEWFAESYQAYFRGDPATWGTRLRDPAARVWFNNNLVPPAFGGGGVLINALGNLSAIGGPAPAIAAPLAGAAVVPGPVGSFVKLAADIAIKAVKIPFDVAVSVGMVPIKIAKAIPPVNWALRWLGF
jgi:hypothetical protein